MDCREVCSKAPQFLDRSLPVQDLEEFMLHVRGCGECLEELELYYVQKLALDEIEVEDELYFDASEAIHKMLLAADKTLFYWKLWKSFVYVCYTLAFWFGGGTLLLQIYYWMQTGFLL